MAIEDPSQRLRSHHFQLVTTNRLLGKNAPYLFNGAVGDITVL
jgi:hypothetical protein